MQPFKIFFITTGLMLFFFFGFAQVPVKNYTREWKKIDELITKRNLPASALTEVKKIYALAKKEKQQAQVVKSVVYMIRLQRDVREDHIQQSIKEIEKEISASNEPVTSIFRSLLAEVFWSYYQQNRWKFFNRTETVSFKKDDPDTWTVSDFHRKISELFLESIKQERLLQQTRLQPYDAIIIKGNMRHLRPTLFDLLAHRALDYFENDERDIAKPAYAFEINTSSAFDPAAAFIRNNFSTRDSLSLKHKALRLYQRLLAFHLVDAKPDALIDADIARLVFVYRHSTHPDKKELYRKALRTIGEKYSDLPAASLPWYHLAQEFKIDADSYNPHGDTTHRYANVRAKEILERIIKQRDSSEGKILAINLLKQITDESFSFSVEKVNIPGQPFRVHVKYRNTGKLHIRVLKATEELKTLLQESLYEDRSWRTLNNVKPIRSWQQALPATNDHQQHSVEIKVDAFPAGEYILLASSDEFKNNSILGARLFYVSNISYLNKGYDHFVLHRETGKPLNDATVQVWEQVYDYQNRTYTTEKGKQYKTDRNGFFKMLPIVRNEKNRSRENYKLDITWNQERFYMNDWIYDQYYYMGREGAQPISNYGIFFFTDRSIYRPGQTVYFKGIAIANDKEIRNKILENLETVVYLRNANGELVDSVSVTTNEFGSFNGRFQLPQGLLNGEFSIYSKNDKGSVNFSVEEYKRPKFFVEYEKIKGSYKVTDSIRITGNAKAYAGNNIDGAVVKYRVVREPRFLYPWLFRGGWWPRTAPMEIAHGETTTNAEGKFFISFEAIPDRSIDRKFDPVFDYRVYADITDINGETRSGETRISAGYKSLLIKTELPASMPVDSLKTISISTTNMSGEFEKATLKVVIYKLKEEKRLTRPRYWQQPNQFVMSKEEFIQNFPYDEYKNESDPKTWEKESKVYERSDSSRVKGEWSMGNGQWAIELRVGM